MRYCYFLFLEKFLPERSLKSVESDVELLIGSRHDGHLRTEEPEHGFRKFRKNFRIQMLDSETAKQIEQFDQT
jgi:hypothetical protein